MQVRSLMRSPVVTVDPGESLQQAAQAMEEQDAAAGVLSVRDVMSVFLPERVHRQEV